MTSSMYAAGPSSGVRSSEELFETTPVTGYNRHIDEIDEVEPTGYSRSSYTQKPDYE